PLAPRQTRPFAAGRDVEAESRRAARDGGPDKAADDGLRRFAVHGISWADMSIAASVGETAAGSARSAWAGVSCSAQGAPGQCARGGWAMRRRRLPARG